MPSLAVMHVVNAKEESLRARISAWSSYDATPSLRSLPPRSWHSDKASRIDRCDPTGRAARWPKCRFSRLDRKQRTSVDGTHKHVRLGFFRHTVYMCGRYRLSRRKQILEEQFAAVSDDEDWSPRYNIAPTQFVPVIRRSPRSACRELSLIRWGLVPSWAKDSSKGAAMINARSETAAIKPAFCGALRFRRCLIPADGFYEWQKVGRAKQPYCFEVKQGELFSFAGLWETWNDPNGKALETCSILTTMSFNGSPSRAMMSACRPGAIEPI